MDDIKDRLKNQPPYDEEPKEEVKEEVVEEVVEEEVEEKEEPKKEDKEEKTKKRTKEQFEKLKKHNQELKEVVKKQNVLDSLTAPKQPEAPRYPEPLTTNVVPAKDVYPGLSPQQIKNTFEGLVDDASYVDTGLLIETLKELQDKNKEAEERAVKAETKVGQVERSMDDFQRTAIMRTVHRKYPKLNPEKEKVFDERLWEAVRNEVIGQWTRGETEDVMSAAEKWSKLLYGEEVKVKKKEKENVAKVENEKKNINALAKGRNQSRYSTEEEAQLISATQQGKRGALAERLRRAEQ